MQHEVNRGSSQHWPYLLQFAQRVSYLNCRELCTLGNLPLFLCIILLKNLRFTKCAVEGEG